MKRLQQLAFAEKGIMTVLFVAAMMSGVMIIAQAYWIVDVVDRVFLKDETFRSVVPQLGWLALALVGRALFGYVSGRAGARLAAKSKQRLRDRLLEHFARNPFQASLSGQSGRKVSVYLDAVDEVDAYFSHYWPQVIQTSVVPLLILIAVFSQHWVSAVIMMVTAPFIPIFFIIIGIATQKKSEQQMAQMNQFSGKFLDVLQGLTTLKLFGQAKRQEEEIERSSLRFRDATMVVLKIAFLSTLMIEFISMLSTGVVALEVALQMVVWEKLTFFSGFFILVLAPEYYLALKDLGGAFHTGRGSLGAADRIFAELDRTAPNVAWGNESLSRRVPEIRLEAVNFSYEQGRFRLEDVSGTIRPGQHIALVGASGAGKTTLLNVIAGLLPYESGDVFVEGRSRTSLLESSWYDTVGFISQKPYLFAGTIADNIALGREATDEEIEQAAREAGLTDVVNALQNGIHTELGEGGHGLSGGERQRLALARAFLKRPGILLFDEPTTGLDLKTERLVNEAIAHLSKEATLITVAHRLHTIRNADQIWFIADGKIEAVGTHETLLRDVPAYREMVDLQKGVDR